MSIDVYEFSDKVAKHVQRVNRLRTEIAKIVIGQDAMVSRLLVGLLTHGHILLEGVPGLAKTTVIKTLAETLATRFQRVQFTPDLLPSDLVGTMIYVPAEGTFKTDRKSVV